MAEIQSLYKLEQSQMTTHHQRTTRTMHPISELAMAAVAAHEMGGQHTKTPSSLEQTIEHIEDHTSGQVITPQVTTCTAPNIFFMGKVSVELPKSYPATPLDVEKAREDNEYPMGSIATYHCSAKNTFTRTCELSADKSTTTWVGSDSDSCDGELYPLTINFVAISNCPFRRSCAVPLHNVPLTLQFDLLSGSSSSVYSMDDIIKFQSALSTATGIPESHISLLNAKQLVAKTVQLDFLLRLAVTDGARVQKEVHSESFYHAVEDALDKNGVEISHLKAAGGYSIGGSNTMYYVAFLCLTAFLLVRDPCSSNEGVQGYCIICGASYVSMTGTTDRCPECRYSQPSGSPRQGSPLSSFNQPGSPRYDSGQGSPLSSFNQPGSPRYDSGAPGQLDLPPAFEHSFHNGDAVSLSQGPFNPHQAYGHVSPNGGHQYSDLAPPGGYNELG
jgi:hypothetical protein